MKDVEVTDEMILELEHEMGHLLKQLDMDLATFSNAKEDHINICICKKMGKFQGEVMKKEVNSNNQKLDQMLAIM